MTAWLMVKYFVMGWIVGGISLVVISCVRHRELVALVFKQNTWAWINAVMPLLIIIFGIWLVIKSAFGGRRNG